MFYFSGEDEGSILAPTSLHLISLLKRIFICEENLKYLPIIFKVRVKITTSLKYYNSQISQYQEKFGIYRMCANALIRVRADVLASSTGKVELEHRVTQSALRVHLICTIIALIYRKFMHL